MTERIQYHQIGFHEPCNEMITTIDNKHKEDWWRSWFNSVYLEVYSHRDDNQAIEEVKTTLSLLPLQPGHRIVDLCCGNGRHCRALYDAGYRHITGIDYSFPMLKSARTENPHIHTIRGDMRLLPIRPASQDALLSYFTSFGYFKTNTENLLVLHEIARVLKPGGWFLLDYLNPNHVKASIEPESEKEFGEYKIIERRRISGDDERIEKEIIIQNWGGTDRTFYESVRLYSYQEMKDMLAGADLFLLGSLGDFLGKHYEANSPRMILFGTRK